MYKFYPSKSGRKYLKEERKKELKKQKEIEKYGKENLFISKTKTIITNNKTLKLRCGVKGCRDTAITLRGKRKACYIHK